MEVQNSAGRGRPRKWCEECRRRVRRLNTPSRVGRVCEMCGSVYSATYEDQLTCSRKCGVELRRQVTKSFPQVPVAPVVLWLSCVECDNQFVKSSRGRPRLTCSHECTLSRNRRRGRDRWREQNNSLPDRPEIGSAVECAECGNTFAATGRRYRYCSTACMGKAGHRSARHRRRVLAASANSAGSISLVRTPTRDVRDTCAECGQRLSGRQRLWCSATCRDRAYYRTRDHVERVAATAARVGGVVLAADHFTLRQLAERDNWRCHICHRRVSQQSASIDHLIPISDGGQHTLVNVALAHAKCNSNRREVGPAQLRLIA